MRKPGIGKSLLATLATVLFATACIIGCGNTDGGSAVETYAGLGTRYVSDGGAGGTISIDVKESLTVGGTSPFSVSVRDASGQPLQFVRVFCESEHGIAIIEPSKGGTAFEHTDTYGNMSGVIGGVSPGSYMLECRAPIEYNLIARANVKITGEIPAGFTGWPGAAGGNLGGGYTVVPEDGDVSITRITFTDLGSETLYVDISQNLDCDDETEGEQPEPWYVSTYKVTVSNSGASDVVIDQVSINVTSTMTSTVPSSAIVQPVVFEVSAGGSTQYEGQLVNSLSAAAGGSGSKTWTGSTTAVLEATYGLEFTIHGTVVGTGEEFTTSASQNLTFGNIDNCEK